jgi:transcriptional regulator with XRE-family HTH domain
MSPKARSRAAAKAKQLRRAMDLAELRRALALSQQQLAKKLRVNQPEIAKIERRADMLLSTLSAVLRAMGADLKIVASFPDHDVHIRNFGKLARKPCGAISQNLAKEPSAGRCTDTVRALESKA